MKKMILAATLLLVCLVQAESALAVTDIGNHWAKSTIESYISRGIVSGYTDGTFKPNNQITRAEFVAMVNKVFGFNTAGSISFRDVPSDSWAYSDIAKGVKAGYIQGISITTFSPDDILTRQEAAVIIARIKGIGVSADKSALLQYADRESIAFWARSAVGAVTKAGYMQGGGDGKFRPQTPMTRAEAVSALAQAEVWEAVVTDEEKYLPELRARGYVPVYLDNEFLYLVCATLDGQAMVPLRQLVSISGCSGEWYERLSYDFREEWVELGWYNDESCLNRLTGQVKLDGSVIGQVAVKKQDGVEWVELKGLLELYGFSVDWDAERKQVIVKSE